MPIFRGFKFFQIFLAIAIWIAFLSIVSSHGFCDEEWVQTGSNINNIIYYNPSSVKIDKEKKIINVSTKWVFTDKGKIGFPKNINDKDNRKLKDIDHSIIVYSFNYKEWKSTISNITEYSKSGKILYDNKSSHEWRDIPHNSVIDLLLNKLLQKYNLKRQSLTDI
jgi:hypothetical protein